MGIPGEIEEYITQVLSKVKTANGKIIGQDKDIIKTKLAKDDKGAWVNHMVEQYLKKQPLDVPPPEFKITTKDIIKEISKREIIKFFGK